MRVATLVLGGMLSVGVLLEARILWLLSSFILGDEGSVLIAGSLFVAIIGALAAAFVMDFPQPAMVLFGLAAGLGYLTAASGYDNQRFYATGYAVLAVMAFLGWREQQSQLVEAKAERVRQDEQLERLERLITQRPAPVLPRNMLVCPSCTHRNPTGTKYCEECGGAIIKVPAVVGAAGVDRL